MKRLFIFALLIILVIIGLRIMVVAIFFYTLKDTDQIILLTQSIISKIELGSTDPRCQKIDYFNSNEFTCLKAKGENCDVGKMNLATLKDIEKRLEKAIQECVNSSK